MSAVSYSSLAPKPYKAKTARRQARRTPLKPTRPTIHPFPKEHDALPLSLQFLSHLQQGSSAIACILVALALGVYGWTVYMPTLWSREFKKLETLQRHERDLIAANETLKHQLAEQAERPESGLAQPHPSQVIFLAPQTATSQLPKDTKAVAVQHPSLVQAPLAY